MIFLTEWTSGVEFLTEQTSTGKKLYIEGPMIQTEKVNRNGRIYPKGMMEKSVDKYNKDYVQQRRAIGEVTHPNKPFCDMKDAALMIESLNWHGDNVIGKALVLDNPNGTILKSLIEANFNLGMSTRGLGDVRKGGSADYVDNYLLNAIDAVDMPSGQDCYVNAINESTEWIFESASGIWTQKVNQTKAHQLFLENFEHLLKQIKSGKK